MTHSSLVAKLDSVPNSITVNTGDQIIVSETIDDFFIQTKDIVQEAYGLQDLGFQIKSGELSNGPNHVTDDRVTYLSYRDVVLASVLATRTEFNYVRYTFFRNSEGVKDLESKE